MGNNGQKPLLKLPLQSKRPLVIDRDPEYSYGITEQYLSIFPGYGRILDWAFHGSHEAKWTHSMLERINGEEIIEGFAGTFLAKRYRQFDARDMGRKMGRELIYALIALGASGIYKQKGFKEERKLAFERTHGIQQISLDMQEKAMNPHTRKERLMDRLEGIPKGELKEFTETFYRPLHTLVPRRQYEKMMKEGKRPSQVTCLHFLPPRPRKGEHSGIYARRIMDQLASIYREGLEPLTIVPEAVQELPKWYDRHFLYPPGLRELAAKRRAEEAIELKV